MPATINIVKKILKIRMSLVTSIYCLTTLCFLSSTYKCNFLGADNKQ